MGRVIMVLAANPHALSAVHRQHNAGDELRLVRRKEERRASDVPRRAHLAAQRNLRIAFADQIFLRDVARFHLAFDGHRRVDQSRHDGVHADAVFRIAYGQRLSHRVNPGLGNLVGREARGRADGGDRRYIDNASLLPLTHHPQHLPAGEKHSLEIRVQDPIPRLFAETDQFPIAGAYADVVMQDVDSAIGVERRTRERAAIFRPRDVGFANEALAAFGFDHRLRFARRFPIPINQNHAGAFARKEYGRGAAIADSVPRRLSRAHNYGDFVLKSHDLNPAIPSSSLTPSVLSAIDTRLYWPTVKIRSSICRVSYVAASASQTAS